MPNQNAERRQMGPGDRLGPYEVTAPLGSGGMGDVFRARDTRLQRDVAVKVLPPDFAADADRLRRFEQEAKTLAALNHPNLLTVFDTGIEGGGPYLVSELLEGRTLREELSAGALATRKVTSYALQLATGLAAAHSKGVVHRDLKPENIFVTRDGRLKILDFGLAKLRSGAGDGVQRLTSPSGTKSGAPRVGVSTEGVDLEAPTQLQPPIASDATEPGRVLGTPSYMAPEQVRGEPADQRADIFAFGCVLYEMLSGQRAFRKETAAETMAAILNEEPQELGEDSTSVPPALSHITRRCLEKGIEHRFQSAADLAFALETLSGSTTVSRPLGAQRRPPVPALAYVLGGSGLLALAVVVALNSGAIWPRRVATTSATSWLGERFDGPLVAMAPRVSPDGKELAFATLVDGLSQVAVMIVDTGDWRTLTTNRSRGLAGEIGWSPDGSHIFYDRSAGSFNGVYRIPKYGGEERLVLERCGLRKVLPDGSLLVLRGGSLADNELHRYWPERDELRRLNGVPETGILLGSALVRDGDGLAAVIYGRNTNALGSSPALWRINLDSGQAQPFLTSLNPRLKGTRLLAFGASPDGRRFVFDDAEGGLHRVLVVDLERPEVIRTSLPLTAVPTAVDMDRDGNLFVDQSERPAEILRGKPGGAIERIPLPPLFDELSVLPLPNDVLLVDAQSRGQRRLMLIAPGKDPRPFLESKLESSGPLALLGTNHVVFALHTGSTFNLAIASLEGRNLRTLDAVSAPLREELSVAGAPDGNTIYYASGGGVFSLPTAGGTPARLCPGQSVAVDPNGQFLVIRTGRGSGEELIRYSLVDRTQQPLRIAGTYPLVMNRIASNAVAQDGRILLQVAPLDSWFWSAAVLDPKTGAMQLATEYDADMGSPGWDREGRLVASAMFFRSSIWRFRPEGNSPP
jgi:serine/threonine protein kinase